MRCANCQTELSPGERFCGNCGRPVQAVVTPTPLSDTRTCPGCGAVNNAAQRFCGSCGQPLSTPSPVRTATPPTEKSRVLQTRYVLAGLAAVAVLLWLTFFGRIMAMLGWSCISAGAIAALGVVAIVQLGLSWKRKLEKPQR